VLAASEDWQRNKQCCSQYTEQGPAK